jgi:hypothetical protein
MPILLRSLVVYVLTVSVGLITLQLVEDLTFYTASEAALRVRYFSVFASAVIGFIALVLGAVYYYHKHITDKKNLQQQRRFELVRLCLAELRQCDQQFLKLADRKVDKDLLILAQHELQSSFGIFTAILEEVAETCQIAPKDLSKILSVNSFVDNSQSAKGKWAVPKKTRDMEKIIYGSRYRAAYGIFVTKLL